MEAQLPAHVWGKKILSGGLSPREAYDIAVELSDNMNSMGVIEWICELLGRSWGI